MTTKSGIYKIINILNGHFYYGSSVNISSRWANHKKLTKSGSTKLPHLYSAMRKHGINKFEIKPIIVCEKQELEYYEQFFLDKYYGLKECYNASPSAVAPWRGRKMSKLVRKKISESMKGRKAWNKGLPRTTIEKRKIRASTLKKIPLAISESEWSNVRLEYFVNNRTMKEIANEYDVAQITIRRILVKDNRYNGIERRGGWNKGIKGSTRSNR